MGGGARGKVTHPRWPWSTHMQEFTALLRRTVPPDGSAESRLGQSVPHPDTGRGTPADSVALASR